MIRTELSIFALNEKTCLQFSASRPVSVFSQRKRFLYLIFKPSSALTLKSPFYLHHNTYKNHGELTTSFSFAWISSDVSFLLQGVFLSSISQKLASNSGHRDSGCVLTFKPPLPPLVSNKNKKRTKCNLNKERIAKGLIRDT